MIYVTLFLTFFKIGLFTLGCGYAVIPLIQEDMLSRGWMTKSELVDLVAISESTPGPFAVNAATYAGVQTAGVAGAACSTLGLVMPAFIILLIVARCFLAFKANRLVQGAMAGIRPAVVGLIASAVFSIATAVFFPGDITLRTTITYLSMTNVVILLLMLFLMYKKMTPILVVLFSALLGIAFGYAGEWLGL